MKKLSDIIWLKNENNSIQNSQSNIQCVKELLNSTGSGFCLAKFTQVTMHLGTGTTHACHHPTSRKVPIEAIETNPAVLFNTPHLKTARKEMLDGGRPNECEYCWRIEDNNGISDRFYKSLEPWAINKHDYIQSGDPMQDYLPAYLEVDFSNVCNFKCAYCGPEYSTKWVEDLNQHGPIKLLENTEYLQWAQGWQRNLDSMTYKNSEFNPYLDAFWKWFPEVYKELKVYRITGGEPLLSKETFRSIDWLIENPNPNLEFSINSNLGAPEKLWNRFVDKIKILVENKSVARFTIFTSVDGWGERAEYARSGLNFGLFIQRFEQLLNIGNVRCTVMCTFNIFSVTSIMDLLSWQLALKRKYNNNSQASDLEIRYGFKINEVGDTFHARQLKNPSHSAIVGLDVPYLRNPSFLDAQYIDYNLIQQYVIPAMHFVAKNTAIHAWNSHQGFEEYELEKIKRICIQIMNKNKFSQDNDDQSTVINRAKFYDFVNELDKRNSSNFLATFPEMEEFYNLCKESKNKLLGND